ncbi:unnamed protein product [Dicrocoelium dendriticum]|nr:unnamed protein product [Dicrocoelium dendriticum]
MTSNAFLMIFYFLISFAAIETVLAKRRDQYHPVVLVPGIIASRAYVRSRGEVGVPFRQIWLNISSLLNPKQFTREFGLTYQNTTQRSYDNKEFEVIFPGWGDTTNLEYLDESQKLIGQYYNTVAEELLTVPFYKRNISLRGAPYDFRRAAHENEKFMIEFKYLIEETYAQNELRRVVIVAHSMGTMYCQYFLNSQSRSWKKTYVEAFVALSGPYGGAMKAMTTIASGENYGVPFYPTLALRPLLRSFTSLGLLLPDQRLWPAEESTIITPKVNYSIQDMKEFFEDINYSVGYDMFRTAKHALDYFNGPTGVDNVYCFHGTGVPTIEKAIYKSVLPGRKSFPDQWPQFVYGDGDGSVNLRSLTVLTTRIF